MIRILAVALLLPMPPQDPAPKDETVIVTVEKGSITPTVDLEGSFESVESAEIKVRLEAYTGDLILVKAAAAGSPVKKGDPILSIDKTALKRQIATAENDLRVARATLEKAEADLKLGQRGDDLALAQAELALKNARMELKVFKEVDGKHLIENADLSVKLSEDAVSDQKEELDQLKKMYKSEDLTNATAEIVVRRAERSLKRAEKQLVLAREEAKAIKEDRYPHQLLGKEGAVESASHALETLKVAQALGRVQREVDLAKAKLTLAQQEEALTKLNRDVEGFSVEAPFDGRVFYGQLQQGNWATAEAITAVLKPGEKLTAGTILMTVCGANVQLRADLPEASYLDSHIEQSASILPVAASDAKMSGRVVGRSLISAAKISGPVFELKIELKEQKPELLPGMKAKATLTGATLKDIVVVPSNALTPQGAKFTVNVTKDGKANPREVTVGKSDGKMTEIKSGLEAGEKIVVPK